jgi:hypothetical protein
VSARYTRTDKSVLVIGDRVVAKSLAVDDEHARARFAHEADVHRGFVLHPPPVGVPRLMLTDGVRLLVLQRAPGQPLGTERYPARPLAQPSVDAALQAISKLNAWQPPHAAFTSVLDYPRQFRRYRRYGQLSNDDESSLLHAYRQWADSREFNHGAVLPSNVLLDSDADVALLDWQHAGWYLPGFDLALLYTLLGNTPYALRRIEEIVAERNIEVPFTVNLALVLARELRTQLRLPASQARERALVLLRPLWEQVHERLSTLAGPDLAVTQP